MPIGGRRRQLAKSADSGKCGNKAGLPSTVGVSMAHRRAFKMGKNCCKNDDIDGCRGPTDRPRVSDNYVDVTLSSTYVYTSSKITVTLSGGVASRALAVGDFTNPGLTFGTGTATATTATFTHTGLANTLVPGKEFTITLNADTVKNAAGKFLSTATTTQQVNSSTKIKILSLTASNPGVAVVQFDSTVSDYSNNALVESDFSVNVNGAAAAPTTVAFIGDQVGGITYKITHSAAFASGNTITITSDDTNRIYETSNGLTISEDKAGVLGNSYPNTSTSTTATANPRTVA
jgi:hypothetical protein